MLKTFGAHSPGTNNIKQYSQQEANSTDGDCTVALNDVASGAATVGAVTLGCMSYCHKCTINLASANC